MIRILAIAVSVTLMAFLAEQAAAVDGEVLLTRERAAAGNITPGDAPGYPITLSRAGSYKLAANLSVPVGKNGIEVTGDNVTLDFAGFALIGRFPSGSENGVVGDKDCLTIRNGSISGFDGRGISGTGDFWVIDTMRLLGSVDVAIFAAGRSWIVRDSVVDGGMTFGATAPNALITNNFFSSDSAALQSAHLQGNFFQKTNAQIGIGTVLGNTFNSSNLQGGTGVGVGNNTFLGSSARSGGLVDLHPNVCNGGPCP